MEESIKTLLEKDYIVICDTNVYLRIYDYSPEFAYFAIECLKKIQNYIKIPFTTFKEYNKHYRAKYDHSKKKIEEYNVRLLEKIDSFHQSIDEEFKRIEQYNFPDMSSLHTNVIQQIESIRNDIKSYCDSHELLIAVNDEYLKVDPIKKFVDSLSNNILKQYDFSRIYDICEDGEKRFKNNTPPGFKDKDKQGLRQYSDLILWNEIIDESIAQGKNVLFITDDVKIDWWEPFNNNGTVEKRFHPKLVREFNKKTNCSIIGITSKELFSLISDEFNVEKLNTIDMALSQNTENYIGKIMDSAFEKIQDEIAFSGERFISEYNNIGSEGLSDLEIEEYELIDYDLIEQIDKTFIYLLTYKIKATGTSQEYQGRDDDTKEVITSPDNKHEFEGIVKVQVERRIDDFIDLVTEDTYETAYIESCELEETNFIHWSESEYDEYDQYNLCPRCGKVITYDNDAGNGFCINCSNEYDDI